MLNKTKKRGNQKKLILDILPKWMFNLQLISLIFIILISIFLFLFEPIPYRTEINTVDLEKLKQIAFGNLPYEQQIVLKPYTRNLSFRFQFIKSPLIKEMNFKLLSKLEIFTGNNIHDNLENNDNLEYKNNFNNFFDKSPISKDSDWRELIIICPVDSQVCESENLFKWKTLPFSLDFSTLLEVSISFKNLNDLIYKDRLLLESIYGVFEITSENYTIQETLIRLSSLIFSVIILIGFITILFKRQERRYWKIDQKLVISFLVFLILFNNPLFIFDILGLGPSKWLGILTNLIFESCFYSYFIFMVYYFSHSILSTNKERNTKQFIFPKLLIALFFWILIFSILINQELSTSHDIIIENNRLHWFQENNLLSLLTIPNIATYFIFWTSMFIAIISLKQLLEHPKDTIVITTSKRFRYFAFESSVVLFCVLLMNILKVSKASGRYQTFQVEISFLINIFAILLAFLLLPSQIMESDMRDIIVEQFERELEEETDQEIEDGNLIKTKNLIHEEKDLMDEEANQLTDLNDVIIG